MHVVSLLPWIEIAVSKSLQNADQRQTLALGADVEPEQFPLLRGRPWLLTSSSPQRLGRWRREAAVAVDLHRGGTFRRSESPVAVFVLQSHQAWSRGAGRSPGGRTNTIRGQRPGMTRPASQNRAEIDLSSFFSFSTDSIRSERGTNDDGASGEAALKWWTWWLVCSSPRLAETWPQRGSGSFTAYGSSRQRDWQSRESTLGTTRGALFPEPF